MSKHTSSNHDMAMVAPQEVRKDAAIVSVIYMQTKLSFLFSVFCSFLAVSFIIVGSYVRVQSIRHCAPTYSVSQHSVFSTIANKSLLFKCVQNKNLSGSSELRKNASFYVIQQII